MHNCAYNVSVQYEWDPAKARANLRKHGVRFADAILVLEDDAAITLHDPHEQEDRWVALGQDANGRILVVVYTWRGERVRLISARLATAREREQYQGNT